MDKGDKTKKRVLDAAVGLFNTKGYNGASIRAIADEAGVNVAIIAYYFGNKQGLLETLMLQFFEGYIEKIDAVYAKKHVLTSSECLLLIIQDLLSYQQVNHNTARFVHRELTLDNTLVRELMVTYFMKEKHYLSRLIERGIEEKEFQPQAINFVIMQLRALITMPYSQPQYIREVFHLLPQETYFVSKYIKHVELWLNQILFNDLAQENNRKTFSAF